MRLPNLLIVGAQKSGTTWLHASLKKSAHVFGSSPKELGFFNRPNFAETLATYAENFPEKPGATYYMESTPHYFRLPRERHDIAKSIKQTLGNPKIIVLFRNPVDRYESAAIHHMMKGRTPYAAVIEDVTNENRMLSFGRYAKILPYWRELFPDIGIFFHDDIAGDPMAFLNSVFSYLGVENDLIEADIDFRTNDRNRKMRQIVPQWDSMPKLSAEARKKLHRIYRADISLLEELTNRDLSAWRARDRRRASDQK